MYNSNYFDYTKVQIIILRVYTENLKAIGWVLRKLDTKRNERAERCDTSVVPYRQITSAAIAHMNGSLLLSNFYRSHLLHSISQICNIFLLFPLLPTMYHLLLLYLPPLLDLSLNLNLAIFLLSWY